MGIGTVGVGVTKGNLMKGKKRDGQGNTGSNRRILKKRSKDTPGSRAGQGNDRLDMSVCGEMGLREN